MVDIKAADARIVKAVTEKPIQPTMEMKSFFHRARVAGLHISPRKRMTPKLSAMAHIPVAMAESCFQC